MPTTAGDPIDPAGRAELTALVARCGWEVAQPLILAVAGVGRMEDLHLVTNRHLATLRIALTVLAER